MSTKINAEERGRESLLAYHYSIDIQYDVLQLKQESRAAARKPRDAASVLFR